uniref:Uncharacterized protein n=2 Tax=Ascarididae TaxID=6250 RepID=A0A914RNR6_PAREQ
MMNDDTPEYIKQRQGKRGEFSASEDVPSPRPLNHMML